MTTQLVVERVFEADCEEIFAAWTDPVLIAQWFFVGASWRAEAENELKVGGSYRLTMHTDAGETHVMHGQYLELERPRRLSFTWSSHVAKDTTVLVELEPTAGGTRLKLTHTLSSDEDIVRAHAMGWEGCLESLGRLLASNAGP